MKRFGLTVTLATLLAGAASAQSLKTDNSYMNTRIQNIYATTMSPAQHKIWTGLNIGHLVADFRKPDELKKLAPHLVKDDVLDATNPEFYQNQPAPLVDAIDDYMASHYLALAKMGKELDDTHAPMTGHDYDEAQHTIDLINPDKYIIKIPDHGIWYDTRLANVDLSQRKDVRNETHRQVIWSTCKDQYGREVEIRITRELVEMDKKSVDDVTFLDPAYDSINAIIQARYKGEEKWRFITTETQRNLDEVQLHEAQQARNPIKSMYDASKQH